MEIQPLYYDPVEVTVTSQGNKVSRKCAVQGSQNIKLNGNSILMADSVIRGDLTCVQMGRYCVLRERSVIQPPYKHFTKGFTYFPVHVGDYVLIEEDCVVSAVSIGSFVHIGPRAVVGASSVLKDCCYVMPGSVIPPDSVIPPFSIVGGNPARVIGELPLTNPELMRETMMTFYDMFQPRM